MGASVVYTGNLVPYCMRKNILIGLLGLLFLSACSEIKTNDAQKAYLNWTNEAPPKEVKVIDGKYWQSGHWTREYEVFLHLKVSREWSYEYVKQNGLRSDSSMWVETKETPIWFKPSTRLKHYSAGNTSQYFWDSAGNECYLHELQL